MIKAIKRGIGIDISGSTVKIAAARSIFGSVPAFDLAESRIAPGGVSRGRIRDRGMVEAAFLAALKNLRPRTNLYPAAFALPEEITFLHTVMLGEGDGETAEKKVSRELSCLVPLPLSELYHNFETIDLPDGRKAALVFAAIKKEVDAWRDFLWQFRIRVEGFEPGAIAAGRYLAGEKSGGWILLDIGRLSSSVYAFYKGHPLYSSTEQIGGKTYFERIRTENTKKGYKLDDYDLKNFSFTSIENQLEALEEVLVPLRSLILEAADGFERLLGSRPVETVAVGGFSRHPELIGYLSERIPEQNIAFGKGYFARGYGESAVSYAQAVGSAVKSLDAGHGQGGAPLIRASKSAVTARNITEKKSAEASGIPGPRIEKLAGRFPAWAGVISVISLFSLLSAYIAVTKIGHKAVLTDNKEISGELKKASINISIPANFGFARQEGSIRAQMLTLKSSSASLSSAQDSASRQAKGLIGKDDMLLPAPFSVAQTGAGKYEFVFFKLNREDALHEVARKAGQEIGTDQFRIDKVDFVKAVKLGDRYSFEAGVVVGHTAASGSAEIEKAPLSAGLPGGQETPSDLSGQAPASSTVKNALPAPAQTATSTQAQAIKPLSARVKDLGGKKLNMRENPSASAKILGKLDQRSTVDIIGTAKGWARIRTREGREGWVMEQFLENY